MPFNSKKTPLIILAIIALISSRVIFTFVNDPEGPNLLIVLVLAAFIYAVLVGVYVLVNSIKVLSKKDNN